MTLDTPFTYTIDRVRSQPLQWLWPGVIARGKLTILAGDPGLGKSFLTLDMAARASRGDAWPGAEHHAGTPAGVVMLNAEDDPADTIRPRLEAMEADLARVCVLDSISCGPDRFRDFVLGEDTHLLRHAIDQTPDTALVVIDPVSAFVGATDSYNNAQVRAMLKPLSDAAADTGVAVVLVTHLRKGGDGPAVQRAMGSLAFAAAARSVLVVSRHPDDADLRVLAIAKNNLAPDRRGFVYAIEDGVVAWHGRFEGTADEVAAGHCRTPGRMPSPALVDFGIALDSLLTVNPRATAEEVRALAEALEVSWSTAKAAATKRRLGVRTYQEGTQWWWEKVTPERNNSGGI